MLSIPAAGRSLVLLLAFSATAALAQTVPSPYIDKDGASTYEADVLTPETTREIDAAVTDAMSAASDAMADEATPEDMSDALRELEAAVAAGEISEEDAAAQLGGAMEEMATTMAQAMGAMFGLSPEDMAEVEMTSSGTNPSGGTTRLYRRRSVQTYPVVQSGYGMDGDGFPDQMVISGTILDAGSLRVCKFDEPPVSRWLRVRVSSTSLTYPSQEIVIAVQCHEDKKELLVGRRVRLEVWKSLSTRPIRMARDNAPFVGTPLYESFPGNVRLGG